MLKTIFRSLLLGIGIGVLLAPRAGSETRRLLSEKFSGVLEGVDELTTKLDRSNESFEPQQHYVESTTREVNSSEPLPM